MIIATPALLVKGWGRVLPPDLARTGQGAAQGVRDPRADREQVRCAAAGGVPQAAEEGLIRRSCPQQLSLDGAVDAGHYSSMGLFRSGAGRWRISRGGLAGATLLSGALASAALLPGRPALAQAGACLATDYNLFSLARRARRSVADYERLRQIHRDDLARNARLYQAQTGQPMPWGFGVAGVVEWERSFGFEACTNLGPWPSSLAPLMLGAIGTLAVAEPGLELEVFALATFDQIQAAPAQTTGADGGVRDPSGMAYAAASQTMFGGRVAYRDWATVVAAYLQDEPLRNVAGDDGRQLLLSDAHGDQPGRIYLGAGVPRYALFADLIVAQRDATPDILALRTDEIALPWLGLSGRAGLAYIADERQATLELGVGGLLEILSADLSLEHRPLRLRHARLRLDRELTWGWEPDELARIQPGAEAYPRFAFDLGGFAELSWFNSRYLEERTGRAGAWGVYGGGFVRPDITILMGRLDLYCGFNQPERLAQLSELVGHWQFGLRLHGRFGL